MSSAAAASTWSGDRVASALQHVEPHRFTVAQYHAMRDAGILGEDDRVELLDGILVVKMTKRPPHRLVTGLVREALEQLIGDGYYVDSQEPITLSRSEPEPDVMVVRGDRRAYADRHPGPDDVPLVIEVSDDSLERDRQTKLALYARDGVAEYWIVEVRGRRIDVHRDPRGATYASRVTRAAGDDLVVKLDGVRLGVLAVDALLP